jgi:glycosyltransferase involved in cell wall biosynthesis
VLRVNLVFKGHWILERLATELRDQIPGVDLNASGWPPRAVTDHDVTYCLPGKNIRHFPTPPENRWLIGYFTHGDDRTRHYWQRFHVCLAMNARMAARLRELGARHVEVIRPGTDPPARPIVFGVNARSVEGRKPKSRKGLDLVAAAVDAGFTVVGCSPDPPAVWPCPITHGTEDRAAFYRSIDYLLVTSRDEGGPMVVPEALAHGVPVIAPDVGWCWEYPVIRYPWGVEGLLATLTGLATVPSWQEWAEAHRRLFARLERKLAVPA